MKNYWLDKNRLGIIKVSDFILDEAIVFLETMPNCKIVDINKDRYWEQGITTLKINCSDFDDIKSGNPIPTYDCIVQRHGNKIQFVEWKRL